MKKILYIGAAVLVAGAAYYATYQQPAAAQSTDFVMPELTDFAQIGEQNYNGTCAACHGVNLAGTDQGPPFLHNVYNKGHHGDMSFVVAVKQGSRAHHWPFGDMPAQEHITDEELASIITYVREVQAANGF